MFAVKRNMKRIRKKNDVINRMVYRFGRYVPKGFSKINIIRTKKVLDTGLV